MTTTNNGNTCDCERTITTQHPLEKDHSPLHHAFSKILIEELFDSLDTTTLLPFNYYDANQYPLYSSMLPTTDSDDFFQPPRN